MAKAATTDTTASAVKTETRWRVIINSDGRPGGNAPITLTVKGIVNHVPRDTEVLLNKAQLGVLQDSRVRGYEIVGETGVRAISGRNRYSYNILGQVEVPVGTVSATPVVDDEPPAGDGGDESKGAEGAAS
uniref:Uncharacterized protein n=1 Tax=Desulfovibrio sp. U5L TaxID=596152 RepID=I2Q1E0_9BACT